jgi:hypothetical protein
MKVTHTVFFLYFVDHASWTIFVQCVQKVAVHLQKVLEVMSTSIYTDLNSFNFIRKHLLQICVQKAAVHLYKVLEVMSMSFDTDNQIYVP